MIAKPTDLITASAVVGAVCVTSPAVSERNTCAPTVNVGKAVSARMIPLRSTVIGLPSVEVDTAMPHCTYPAVASALASVSSHRESATARYTTSPNAIVAPPVPVTVIQLRLS